jgi:hypothetical protein
VVVLAMLVLVHHIVVAMLVAVHRFGHVAPPVLPRLPAKWEHKRSSGGVSAASFPPDWRIAAAPARRLPPWVIGSP